MDFEKLFDEYYDKIYVYIFRRVNNSPDAEDLTADVFMKAFAHPYDPKLARFSTYIYTIAMNVLKNYYRRAAKTNVIFFPSELDGGLPSETDLLGGLITREEYAELKNVLSLLPERQYDVVYRRYYLDQSFKEISVAMGVSETNAWRIHTDAIKKLKKLLEAP